MTTDEPQVPSILDRSLSPEHQVRRALKVLDRNIEQLSISEGAKARVVACCAEIRDLVENPQDDGCRSIHPRGVRCVDDIGHPPPHYGSVDGDRAEWTD